MALLHVLCYGLVAGTVDLNVDTLIISQLIFTVTFNKGERSLICFKILTVIESDSTHNLFLGH